MDNRPVYIDASGETYRATGGRLIDAGWRRVYPYSEAKETILPEVKPGERLPIIDVKLEEKETQPPHATLRAGSSR